MSSYLALDIGEKRIGVALADQSAPFPAALTTLKADESLKEALYQLLRRYRVVAVVVGMPRNQQGEKTAQSRQVEHVVSQLKIPKNIAVFYQDESLTSVKAEEELARKKKPYSKEAVDALAATYILEDFIKTTAFGQFQEQISKNQDTYQLPSRPKQPTPSPKDQPTKNKKRSLLWVIAAILACILIALITLMFWYNAQLSPRTQEDSYHIVSIKTGSTTGQIADELEQKGVIKSARAFRVYVKFNHITNLQAGDYRLSSKQSVREITDTLASGKITSVDVLIPPGLRLDQIEDILVKNGYTKSDLEAALTQLSASPLLESLPSGANLEGYLFPDTYKIGPDTTAKELLTLILNNFQSQITPDITTGLAAQGLTLRQGIILASIVQKEVSDPDVQPTVAQVFIKRYKAGEVLGSDVTYMYAAKITGQTSSPELDSPYNTRKYPGLPPGPIANFNISALKAVAHPSNTDYSYFVAGDDGEVHFSNTLEEHQALTKQYCTKACQ